MDQSPRPECLSLASIAGKVKLTTEQVARLCGVSRRQLSYWVQRGIVPAEDGYSVGSVERVLLLKRELERGRSLRQAGQSVAALLAERAARRQAILELAPEELARTYADLLERFADAVRALRATVVGLDSAPALQRLSRRLDQLRVEEWLAQPAGAVSIRAEACELAERLSGLADCASESRAGGGDAAAGHAQSDCVLDEDELLSRLMLNATDVARVCGVTVRKLTYWSDKGIVETAPGEGRLYSVEALRKVMLIRQEMAAGQTLERSAAVVGARLAREAQARQAAAARPVAALRDDLDARLERIERTVAARRANLPLRLALGRLRIALAELERSGVECAPPARPADDQAIAETASLLERAAEQVEEGVRRLGASFSGSADPRTG